MNEIGIALLTPAHLATVTHIHRGAFQGSALTRLGQEAVGRYYAWLLSGPHKDRHAIGAWQADRLVGFSFGGRYNGAMTGFLRQNWAFLVRLILTHPWYVISNPLIRDRILLALQIIWKFRKENPAVENRSPVTEAYYGILSIAVDPDAQRQGIGHALVQAATEEALNRGANKINLSVDKKNVQAISFYLREGFEKRLIDNEWGGVLIKSLTR